MKITKVCCQGCGADLDVDESIRYVTCNYCHARLEVVHDTSVTHTRQLDKIERTTDQLTNKIKILELQNDLERLDREWESERRTLLVRDKHGNVSEPSFVGPFIAGIITIGSGIYLVTSISAIRGPNLPVHFPFYVQFMGPLAIGIGIFTMVRGKIKAGEFKNEKAAYEARRRQLLARIESERTS